MLPRRRVAEELSGEAKWSVSFPREPDKGKVSGDCKFGDIGEHMADWQINIGSQDILRFQFPCLASLGFFHKFFCIEIGRAHVEVEHE